MFVAFTLFVFSSVALTAVVLECCVPQSVESVMRSASLPGGGRAVDFQFLAREAEPAIIEKLPLDLDALTSMQQAALIQMTESHVKRAITARLLEDSQDRPSLSDYRVLTDLGLSEKPAGKTWHQLTSEGRFAALDLQHKLCIKFDIHLLTESESTAGWQARFSCPCGYSTMVRRSRTARGNANHGHSSFIASRQGINRLRVALAPGIAEG